MSHMLGLQPEASWSRLRQNVLSKSTKALEVQQLPHHCHLSYILKVPSMVRRISLHYVQPAAGTARNRPVPAVSHPAVQVSGVKALPAHKERNKTLLFWGRRRSERI